MFLKKDEVTSESDSATSSADSLANEEASGKAPEAILPAGI